MGRGISTLGFCINNIYTDFQSDSYVSVCYWDLRIIELWLLNNQKNIMTKWSMAYARSIRCKIAAPDLLGVLVFLCIETPGKQQDKRMNGHFVNNLEYLGEDI